MIPLGPGKLRAPASETRAFLEAQRTGTEVHYGGRGYQVESVEELKPGGIEVGEVVVRLR